MGYDLPRVFTEVDRRLSVMPRLRLARLATDLGLERHTIERAVRKLLGTCFRDYQQGKVLAHALVLLRERPTASVKQIALELGYTSPDAFSRFLKKMTGKTPTEVRLIPDPPQTAPCIPFHKCK
jgi:AraC-like DNA-binding protein